MNHDIFDQKVETLQERLQALWQQTDAAAPMRQSGFLTEVLEELATALEELHVAQEELHQQNEELIAAQHAIEAERQRYWELFEFAPDGYLVTDAWGTIREANHTAATLLRVPQNSLVGKPFLVFIVEEDRKALRILLMQALERSHPGQEWEGRLQPRGEASFPVALTMVPARNPQGEIVAFRWLLHDITARKQTEEALKKAKEAAEAADQAKSEFLATMSHELRSPLSVILGYDDLLLDGAFGALTIEQLRPLRRMNENARELLDLISAILDVSRLEAGRLPVEIKEVSVHDLLATIKAETQSLQKKSGLIFVWQIENNLPLLDTDPGKLKIVIKNLINNAVKFTEQGTITVTAQSQEGGVAISVTDTGIGIPREALALIFEPFRQVESSATRRYEGTGLGLHIVKRFLELLGGKVTAESEMGRGSTFRVWMPIR
jgi:PAS domain S-box-containing protein